ncbi:MAG TPA: zinc-binding dehydrogenase [Candidatus Acidoferrales bacterium]|jgi:NADPH:quinone reductase-like Zn-dependent oxidoreductase|nr:zinc-binding dehydrogenase [Candidatus Acidoferrales bacterium]
MLALTTTGDAGILALTEVPEPEPMATEVLVRVSMTSLNRGEVARSVAAEAGVRPGWDVVGVVERAAERGGGPPVGATVVGLVNTGAWAEVVAVPADFVAVIPDGVTLAQAACLPVAGMTAFRALSLAGFPVGKRVLVTGASGGVGHLAVQLARSTQMTVTGLIRNPEADAGAAAACHHVIRDIADAEGPFDHVLDGVGGAVLTRCLEVVAPHGVVVSYASTLMEPAVLGPRWFGAHLGATLRSLLLFDELPHTQSAASDLSALCALVADGVLKLHIDVEDDWSRAGALARDLLDRRVTGKVVLRIGRP